MITFLLGKIIWIDFYFCKWYETDIVSFSLPYKYFITEKPILNPSIHMLVSNFRIFFHLFSTKFFLWSTHYPIYNFQVNSKINVYTSSKSPEVSFLNLMSLKSSRYLLITIQLSNKSNFYYCVNIFKNTRHLSTLKIFKTTYHHSSSTPLINT